MTLEKLRYVVSDSLFSTLMNQDSEPIIIVDADSQSAPRRLFVVKYVLASTGENSRLVFRNELTGYDNEEQIVYPKKTQLEHLQSTMESFIYGSSKPQFSRVQIQNSKCQVPTVRVIISNELISEIIRMYQFAW